MFLIFLLIWVVLCGHVSVQTAVQGVLVSGLLTLFCYRVLGYSLSKDRFFLRHRPRCAGHHAHHLYRRAGDGAPAHLFPQ